MLNLTNNLIILTIIGFVGAFFTSKSLIDNRWAMATYVTAIATNWVWLNVARQAPLPLASVIFGFVYEASWIVAFLLMGERINWAQGTGIIVAIFGIGLMNHK